ncbi:hypothetical protein QJS04_geneDACA002099 [Acorus gramineus]|uniref:Uncharacterized protein n=1 Tax=Acorus gramineus TaxID=55184 RepID=A0AAV9A7N7_ACOGR|nr:hypothetical protein QJS04_geneDACA002099 [Acorus gramineus]
MGPTQTSKKIDKDDGFFQECVDGRAVDNVRMLMADAVQNAKAWHPGMASAWRRWVIISTDM